MYNFLELTGHQIACLQMFTAAIAWKEFYHSHVLHNYAPTHPVDKKAVANQAQAFISQTVLPDIEQYLISVRAHVPSHLHREVDYLCARIEGTFNTIQKSSINPERHNFFERLINLTTSPDNAGLLPAIADLLVFSNIRVQERLKVMFRSYGMVNIILLTIQYLVMSFVILLI